jgi:hypothetical protein
MPAMTWTHRVLILLAVLCLAGCATGPSSPPRGSQSPRARCLADPHETGTRPLFFLFCIESP